MEFKPSEIALIVLALAIPIGLFVLLLTPGAVDAIVGFLLQKDRMPYVFYGGAAVTLGLLCWRVYRRLWKKPKPTNSPEDPLER